MAISEFISEYSGAIKVLIAAIAMIGIILLLCSTEAGGIVYDAFSKLLTDFYTKASTLGGIK